MTPMAPPSLMHGAATASGGAPDAGALPGAGHSLLDLMYDGFYALVMLKNGDGPRDDAGFTQRITQFLDEFGRRAKQHDASADDIDAAKYAFCAAVDERLLSSRFVIRADWERRPLQLALFGDQLAGENFFNRLEHLRARGGAHLQALEVFHLCLLLGFEGRYMLEGQEKLHYLTARLGDEIAALKGKRPGFAPHAERPDRVSHRLRGEVPPWVLCTLFALIALAGYAGFRTSLDGIAASGMEAYNGIVQLPPRPANLVITLP
jgi:type VI secretion system protein ImpK